MSDVFLGVSPLFTITEVGALLQPRGQFLLSTAVINTE